MAIDMRYHDVWIVIPALNEATIIGDVIADVRSGVFHVQERIQGFYGIDIPAQVNR